MIVAMIIPTGIGCEIGGHNGDATPVARMLGSVCDKLILHPNVVNASDINEMPSNALYVDGGMLDKFLNGIINLKEVRQNKILVVVNKPVNEKTINAVSAARATLGIDAEIVTLDVPLSMIANKNEHGAAGGLVNGVKELAEQLYNYKFDALALHTYVHCPDDVALDYLSNGGVNPWGGVEAIASRMVSELIGKPVAHAPQEGANPPKFNEIVDPRIAAEMLSDTYLFSVLKGLNKAPQPTVNTGLSINDLDVIVMPYGCKGIPNVQAHNKRISVIVVKENKTIYNHVPADRDMVVENYLEAAGMITAMRQGINLGALRRPIAPTKILK